MFELKDYLMKKEDRKNTFMDLVRYFCMGFRPIGTILICVVFMILISIPCVFFLVLDQHTAVFSSILTGVVASGLVAVAIEIGNNIRRNRQRLLVLHEYLMAVANYEQFLKWSADSLPPYLEYEEKHDPFTHLLTKRFRALAHIELEIVPPIDTALENGRELLSFKEIELLTKIEEASNDIAKITNSVITDNMSTAYPIYDVLKEPFKSKIQEFSDIEGMQIIDKDLQSVVYDYCMENLETLDELQQDLIKHNLYTIDESIKEMEKVVAWELVYADDLVPFEIRMKKYGIDLEERKEELKERMTAERKDRFDAEVVGVDPERGFAVYRSDDRQFGVFFYSDKKPEIQPGDNIHGSLGEKGYTCIMVNEEDILDVTVIGCDLSEEEAFKAANRPMADKQKENDSAQPESDE